MNLAFLSDDSQVYSKEDKELVEHFLDVYPEEGCGLLLNKRGKLVWVPCENTAEDKRNYFEMSSKDYIKASLSGDIHSIVHSHPDFSAELSESDTKMSDFLQIPFTVFSVPDLEKVEYYPKRLRSPLLGREYKFGVSDCYSLARDYYYEEHKISLPSIPFEDDWWEKGINYFDDLFEAFGFVEVSEPSVGYLIIFKVRSNIPNHCGLYLGEGLFLHHAIHRLSCRESLYGHGWINQVHRYIRCKQFT